MASDSTIAYIALASIAGKSFCLIFSMSSLALLIPLATRSFKTFSTWEALTLIFSANSLKAWHMSPVRTSSHLKSLALATSFSRISLIKALASVILALTASRTSLSMISAFSFNFLAASLNWEQILSPRTSSHFKFLAISRSFILMCLTISLTSVILALTASRTSLSITSAFSFNFSAVSLN